MRKGKNGIWKEGRKEGKTDVRKEGKERKEGEKGREGNEGRKEGKEERDSIYLRLNV